MDDLYLLLIHNHQNVQFWKLIQVLTPYLQLRVLHLYQNIYPLWFAPFSCSFWLWLSTVGSWLVSLSLSLFWFWFWFFSCSFSESGSGFLVSHFDFLDRCLNPVVDRYPVLLYLVFFLHNSNFSTFCFGSIEILRDHSLELKYLSFTEIHFAD